MEYPLELNDNKSWEISSVWLSYPNNDSAKANEWLSNYPKLPQIPNYYLGQIIKAKLNHTFDGKLFDIREYRIEKIKAHYYNDKWNLSFDCRKINHGHSYTLYEENFNF